MHLKIYETRVAVTEPKADVQLENTLLYNDLLSSGALLESGSNVPTSNERFNSIVGAKTVEPYDKQLDIDGRGPMARILIPKVDIDLPVCHGTSEDVLQRGAGHLQGTSLPVGGLGTRTVITAHRGLAHARMFADLDELEVGDTFIVETLGETLSYRITEKVVVEPDDRETVRAVQGKNLATLVSCTPLGINSHRILVTRERFTPTPEKDVVAISPVTVATDLHRQL